MHGLEGDGAAEELVRQLGLVAVVVDVTVTVMVSEKVLGGGDVGGVEVVGDGVGVVGVHRVRGGGGVELGVGGFGLVCCRRGKGGPGLARCWGIWEGLERAIAYRNRRDSW